MKLTISLNARKLYPEAIFYLDWARKSRNRKTKRKLIIKALKEVKCISKNDLKKRIFR